MELLTDRRQHSSDQGDKKKKKENAEKTGKTFEPILYIDIFTQVWWGRNGVLKSTNRVLSSWGGGDTTSLER